MAHDQSHPFGQLLLLFFLVQLLIRQKRKMHSTFGSFSSFAQFASKVKDRSEETFMALPHNNFEKYYFKAFWSSSVRK